MEAGGNPSRTTTFHEHCLYELLRVIVKSLAVVVSHPEVSPGPKTGVSVARMYTKHSTHRSMSDLIRMEWQDFVIV